VREGNKAIGAGANPVLVKRGIDMAVARLVARLQEVAYPVTTESDYCRVAAISANDDDMVGAVIARALHTVGDGGTVTVEESAAHGMSVDFTEGFEFDNGYLSPYMVTSPASLEAIVTDPYILLCSEKITRVQQLMPLLDKIMRDPRPLVIIAEAVEGTALSMLVHNHVNGIFQCVAVRAPGFGDRRLHKLEDIAAITGGAVLSKHSGFTLETMTTSQLGRAAQVRVTADRTAIVGGDGSSDAVEFRVAQLRAELERATFGVDEDVLTERIGALTGKAEQPTGTEQYGGPIVTAGGVVFIAATMDAKFRAFDKSTGQLLWETTLPAAGYATPSTFAVGGKQYVIIAAGGGKLGTKSGDAYLAFTLP